MYRIFRPGTALATVLLLGFSGVAQGADYLLDSQANLAHANAPSGETNFVDHDATQPAIAIADGTYRSLVVWSADDAGVTVGTNDEGEPLHLVDGEFEILGKVDSTLSPGTDDPISRISTMGNDEEQDADERARYDARDPVAVWNPVAEEFLVVWVGDTDDVPLVDDEFEIFAQRISLFGEPVGDRIRISAMGDDEETGAAARQRFEAASPAVAVDPQSGTYLVTWHGDDDSGALVDDELEIFARILDADAQPLDPQFRVSVAGDDTQTDAAERAKFDAQRPTVAFNAVSGYFVVAWQADDNRNGMVNGENEIFTQQVDLDGTLIGNAVRVSTMGPDGDASFDAHAPSLAVARERDPDMLDPAAGMMLVAWHGDTSTSKLVEDEFEVHGILLDSGMNPLRNQRRISSMGPDNETDAEARRAFEARHAAVAWGTHQQRFLISWRGDSQSQKLVDDEFEVFARLLNTDGTFVSSEFRVSTQGADDEEDADERTKYAADKPAVAYDASTFILVWSGDTNLSGGSNNRQEIFARRVAEVYSELEFELLAITTDAVAPEPVTLRMKLTNSSDVTATNVILRVGMSDEFPLTWSGCDSVTDNGHCLVGDMQPDDEVELGVTLTTDHVELGEQQSTLLNFSAVSDTALEGTDGSSYATFIPVTVEVEGGSGAFGIAWLLLGAIPLLGMRRRGD